MSEPGGARRQPAGAEAARHRELCRHLIDEHRADPGNVARDAPTLEQLRRTHDAARKNPYAPWGQVVMQTRADAWWAERDRQYKNRPEVLAEIEQLRAEAAERNAKINAYFESLERRIAAGDPRAQETLNEALTRDALDSDPPESSAREDPAEWRAFFREVLGRDMPLNAEYEAEYYSIDAAAPPDVNGWAAEYYEVNYPRGFDYGELAAERGELTFEQLLAQRYRELNASHGEPRAEVTGASAARLAAASFPGPVQPSPPQQDGHEAARQAQPPSPRHHLWTEAMVVRDPGREAGATTPAQHATRTQRELAAENFPHGPAASPQPRSGTGASPGQDPDSGVRRRLAQSPGTTGSTASTARQGRPRGHL